MSKQTFLKNDHFYETRRFFSKTKRSFMKTIEKRNKKRSFLKPIDNPR